MKLLLQKYYEEEIYPHQRELWSDPQNNENVKRAEACFSALTEGLPEPQRLLLFDYSDSCAIILAPSSRPFASLCKGGAPVRTLGRRAPSSLLLP